MCQLPPLSYIPLSALQHYMYCPRQCALIHCDRVWQENSHTIMGQLEHQRVDSSQHSIVHDVYTARSVQLVCHRLGIQGVADAIEYRYGENRHEIKSVRPIEYKHGRPKEGTEDAVQLCAQVLCLEEMHQITIEEASIFYQATKHRLNIKMDAALREQTQNCIRDTIALLHSSKLPAAIWQTRCRGCSLEAICLPRKKKMSVAQFNDKQFVINDDADDMNP